jgi:superfamily II DNA/RNA helicase
VSTWEPLLARTAALRLQPKATPTREAAKQIFDEFVATGPNDHELELASIYYGWTISELANEPGGVT